MSLELSLKEFSVDLQNQSIVNTIVLPQGDAYSRKLLISIYDNGKKYVIPEEASVDMIGSRADGAVVNRHVDYYNDNVITVILRDDELAVKGVAKYKITISENQEDNSIILSSFPFKIKVSEDTYDPSNRDAYPRIDILEDTINKAEKRLNSLSEIDSNIKKNEDIRESNENERVINEDTRKKQEQIRVDAENNRVEEESKRTKEESARKSNESTRQSNEIDRETEESKRIESESIRISSEVTRVDSENIRKSNETIRKTNEENRENNENTRQINESERQTDELKRDTAETSRVNAEKVRDDNESSRQSSETNREEAETARVSAENKRSEIFNEIKSNVEAAIENAEKVNVEVVEDSQSYKIKTTDRSGASKISPNLLNKLSIGTVDTGEYDEEASVTVTGNFGEQKLNLRLPMGKPFKIKKTYSSIDLMNGNIETDLDLYDFCMINTGSVEDEDTGKLYMRDTNGASYITDLSGAQGIQGVKGETGATPNLTIGTVTTGAEGTKASATITGTTENPVINLVIPVGATGRMENVSASSIPYESESDNNTIKDVVDNKLGKTENAASSTKAIYDDNNQKISSYIKNIVPEGTTLTVSRGDGTTFAIATQDTTYNDVSNDTHGLMTPEQKIKLDSLPDTVDSILSDESENPVQNKVIKKELDEKAEKTHSHDDLYLSIDGTAKKASCDENGNNISETYATKEEINNSGGIHIGDTEPNSLNKLWIDIGNGGIAKYYDATSSSWTPVKATWG